MKWIHRHKTLLIVILVVAVVLSMALASLFTSGRISPLSDLLGQVFKPFQNMMTQTLHGIGSFYGYIYEYDGMSVRLEEQSVRIAQLEEELRQMAKLGEENERLRELVGVKEVRPELQFESAQIIARELSNWSSTFTLDKGLQNGLTVGDCVLSAEGYLVGVISEAAQSWSVMVTVVDTDMSAGAMVERTSQTAVAEGRFDLMQNGRLALQYLPPDSDLIIGDLVMTSGVGGRLPGGIPIGSVAAVRAEPDGMSATAELTPAADLASLRVCYVVTDFSLTGEDSP